MQLPIPNESDFKLEGIAILSSVLVDQTLYGWLCSSAVPIDDENEPPNLWYIPRDDKFK